MRRKRLFEAWTRNVSAATRPDPATAADDPALVLADDEDEVRKLLAGRCAGIPDIIEVLVPVAVAGPSRVLP